MDNCKTIDYRKLAEEQFKAELKGDFEWMKQRTPLLVYSFLISERVHSILLREQLQQLGASLKEVLAQNGL